MMLLLVVLLLLIFLLLLLLFVILMLLFVIQIPPFPEEPELCILGFTMHTHMEAVVVTR